LTFEVNVGVDMDGDGGVDLGVPPETMDVWPDATAAE